MNNNNPLLYNPGIPENPSDSLQESQGDLLTNFFQLYEIFSKNHVPLDAVSGSGNHSIVQLFEQNNSQQTDVGEISIYTKEIDQQTDQIFINVQGQEFQFTNYQIYQVNPNYYFTFIPGKIILYFGFVTSINNNVFAFYPPVAKKLISASFCPLQNTPGLKPNISQIVINDFVVGVTALCYPPGTPFPPSNFLIMANL